MWTPDTYKLVPSYQAQMNLFPEDLDESVLVPGETQLDGNQSQVTTKPRDLTLKIHKIS